MATTVLSIPLDAAQLSLQSFRDLARTAESLQVSRGVSEWKVTAADAAAAAGTARTGPEAEVDSTAVFVEVLGRAFSRGIQEAVVRELELGPQPGKPLPARLVLQAIAMAEAGEQALQGVDFMTQMQFSAALHSVEFVDACHAAGLSPEDVSAPQRAAVDARMQQRFAEAAGLKQTPVTPETARQWLHAELLAREKPTF